MEKDKNPFPLIEITPLDVIKAIGGVVVDFFSLHQLASHGSHFGGAEEMLSRHLDEPMDGEALDNLHNIDRVWFPDEADEAMRANLWR